MKVLIIEANYPKDGDSRAGLSGSFVQARYPKFIECETGGGTRRLQSSQGVVAIPTRASPIAPI
jgi:hypothetical protein